MKKIFFLFIIISTSFTTQQSSGKNFLDTKRGWLEFCIGKSTSQISNKIKFLGRDTKGNYGFQGINHPKLFETAPVTSVILSSQDSLTINSLTINLGVVCSSDFQSNTKYINVVSKLNRVFGKTSSTDNNQNLGENFFFWTGKTTVCSFSTKWDATQRHYTGRIVFYPIPSLLEERSSF